MRLGPYTFEGPFGAIDSRIPARSAAVYAVIDDQLTNGYFLLDVGESGDVKERLADHERAECWKRNAKGNIQLYIMWTPKNFYSEERRLAIEKEIRHKFALPCERA